MCGAIVTSPFDVVKTRLQSSLFHEHVNVGGGESSYHYPRSPFRTTASCAALGLNAHNRHISLGNSTASGTTRSTMELCRDRSYPTVRRLPPIVSHGTQSPVSLRDIYVNESPRALFRGLGPTLVGVIPARSINFFAYGNGKQIIAQNFNNGQESSYVLTGKHVIGAMLNASIVGCT